MLWIDSRSIDLQNQQIRDLKDAVKRLEDRNEEIQQDLVSIRPKGDFYLDMQYRILDNPEVLKAWKRFLAMVKMTLDDPVKGLTYEQNGGPINDYEPEMKV